MEGVRREDSPFLCAEKLVGCAEGGRVLGNGLGEFGCGAGFGRGFVGGEVFEGGGWCGRHLEFSSRLMVWSGCRWWWIRIGDGLR